MARAARSSRRRSTPAPQRRTPSGLGARVASEALATWLPPIVGAALLLLLYVLGLLDVLDTTLVLAIDAFLLVAMVLYFPMRYAYRLGSRGRMAAAGFAAAWLTIVYAPIYLRIVPGQRIATVDARASSLPITLPAAGQGTTIDLMIEGHLEPAAPGRSRAARYELGLEVAGLPPQSLAGDFQESWSRQRQGRRDAVDVRTERTAALAVIDNPANADLRVHALAVHGQAAPLLTVSLYRHRLPPWGVGLALGAALLAGAVLFDQATGSGDTAASMVVASGTAVTGAFTFAGFGSANPTFRELAGAAIIGGLVGGPIGGLVAWTSRRRFAAASRARSRGR